MANGIQQYTKLENRLALLSWLNNLFGYASNKELLNDCKNVADGYTDDGFSRMYHHLLSRGSRVKISAAKLAQYDENIKRHLQSINRNRQERVVLRYFQYLSVLYAEIFLDYYFNHPAGFIKTLNDFVDERNAREVGGILYERFTKDDLTKLAYWMATGSGKTLIMHLNYYQFLHYNKRPLDNILLITPNEGLSEQHLRELELSGIPVRRFELNQSSFLRMANEIQVLEITKLVEQKRGGGVSVPVDAFEGYNLILVDEGHKGSGGEAWRGYRDALGKTGFAFEYSATFGQALSAARDDELTKEYGKAIVFDYSYRYFYEDGFGKDFRVLNLQYETRTDYVDILLLGNLLSFYEQLRLYEEHQDELRPYNLEKPLWVFVGSTVNAVYTENKRKRSDVLTVVHFLHKALRDRDWATNSMEKLLIGQSGLKDPYGVDVFSNRFKYLNEQMSCKAQTEMKPFIAALYDDIMARVFHAPTGGGLHLAFIRGNQGEIGLKASNGEHYFGLIYIGDTSAFKNLLEENAPEVVVEEDVIESSLFNDINRADSRINVLIGAKKFIEGWNSWRVSNMGLLNIGRSEGAQIIQLFGRGVRLKGKNMSLKRSAALNGPHPKHITILETLNIFAVRANYMAQFREYLEREGVDTESAIELPLFIKVNEPAIKQDLVIPRIPEGRDFESNQRFALKADKTIKVHVDMSLKVQIMTSNINKLHQAIAGQKLQIPPESLTLVDWEKVYLDLLEYKVIKGWYNLILLPETPHQLMKQIKYELITDDDTAKPKDLNHLALLQDAVTNILRKYMDTFYRNRREGWEIETMIYQKLDENDPNLSFNRDRVSENKAAYILKVRPSDRQFIDAIQKLIEEKNKLYQTEDEELPRIHFDRHLYLPLLIERADKLQTIPPALNPGEAQFVRDLKDFWDKEQSNSMANKEVYVLRNLSKDKGVGFFENRGFYPDFILWILDKQNKHQRIIFVESHGMRHAPAYAHDEKAQLHERLPEITQEIATRSGRNDVSLDSFIISTTPYEELCTYYGDGSWKIDKFAEKHILFFERIKDYDYIHKMLCD